MKIKWTIMSFFKRLLTLKAGFSLIEVLVATGIVSLLGGVGVPKYIEHQRRTRQVEARSILGTVYSAQKNFYLTWGIYTPNLIYLGAVPQGYVRYNAGFNAAQDAAATQVANGIVFPEAAKKDFGQTTSGVTQTNNLKDVCGCEFGGSSKNCSSGSTTTSTTSTSTTGTIKAGEHCAFGNGRETFDKVDLPNIGGSSAKCGSKMPNTGKSFKAVAFADLINNTPPASAYSNLDNLDVWTINQLKQVEHIQNGVKKDDETHDDCQ